jgi:hypothetical protein
LIELADQGGIHQVDWLVIDCHPGDPTLDANIKGLKMRKAW